ncbi:MAG: tRNA (N(6)-L-threonylcarbamoyladenosine(37)-C(2))-methylthiotransferase MtaB [Clostridia bacterium]|nr:tRNA (N(6)-L-threonylcarbamoyladenosine(37)-C(2))-methylthiotransferase MtaB [Clostridia bacterium]
MKTVSFCTLGCRVNQYESRALAELFVRNGYEVLPFGEHVDVCIVNTCAVTEESERKSAQMIRRAMKLCEDVRVCGCFAQRSGEFEGISRLSGCGSKGEMQDFLKIDCTEKGYELLQIGHVGAEKLCGFSGSRAYVKIQDGCNGRCTYCIIPRLRGGVRSRPPEEIISEVKRLADSGYKEIILTGIETAAYNYMPLWELIRRVAEVEGVERLRLGSLDPNVLTPDFIRTVKETKKLMPHFHISLQSGCSRILRLMGRAYTAEDAKEKLLSLKAARAEIELSADIICSFPTETAEELKETAEYLKEIGFLHIHAFSYSKRPDTPAAAMEGQIPEEEKKVRMRYFLEECEAMALTRLEGKVGNTAEVLVEKTVKDGAVGHTADFCEAFIKTNRPLKQRDTVKCTVLSVKDGKLCCEAV